MRFFRTVDEFDRPDYGWIMGDLTGLIEGDLFGEYQRREASRPIEKVKMIAPVAPGKIICIGRNYIEHAKEHQAEIPEVPLLFLKPPSSVIGPGDYILLPPQSKQVEHEAELAVVIGKKGRWISIENALNYVFGYTIANDVTARDIQRKDGQWTRGKGFDTFCPIGPWIETELDVADTLISCRVNQEMRQMSSTREMVFTVSQIISFASSVMTLNPGDVLLTGTPAGVGILKEGDRVEISIEGIGSLINPVSIDKYHSG
jgi:2-keto-4-pentenoate hydratase/2-oxohepta-3-ene-1,7-dioic acid hydratase in catechol pathway